MEIMVDIDVCDKAEEMAKVLNTDVEGIFAIAAYRLGRERMILRYADHFRSP